MKRDFNSWLGTMKDSIASWTYYTDFQKVYENVNKIKVELNIMNSLVGSKNIEKDFDSLFKKYPEIRKCLPLLIAVREKEIKVNKGGSILGGDQIEIQKKYHETMSMTEHDINITKDYLENKTVEEIAASYTNTSFNFVPEL